MAYLASVLHVMIASPSDVPEERAFARDVINEWNYVNAQTKQAVLLPIAWETHAAPNLGVPGQQQINANLLDSCDLLVGIFWSRIGTSTDEAQSGTVEEIEKQVKAGKPAMLYYSKRPLPQNHDRQQFDALQQYLARWRPLGIAWPYNDPNEFRKLFVSQLQITLNAIPLLRGHLGAAATAGAFGTPTVSRGLSPNSRNLLAAAVAGDGVILRTRTLAGTTVQAGETVYGDPGDPRATARWEFALDQLIDFGMVKVANSDKTFDLSRVTELGYRYMEEFDRRQAGGEA